MLTPVRQTVKNSAINWKLRQIQFIMAEDH